MPHKHRKEKVTWNAPADAQTNDAIEEIEERLREEEKEWEDEMLKKIEGSNAKEFNGPTKIDS
jgi:hypothetical protein